MKKPEHSQAIPSGILGDMGVALARFRCGQMGLIFREKPTQDHGIDAEIEVIDGDRATGRLISAQIKCGASYLSESDKNGFTFRFSAEHYAYWTNHSLPVVGVLIDHETEVCYWAPITKNSVEDTGKGYKIVIPRTQTLTLEHKSLLIDLATPVISNSSYQIVSEEDQSTGPARRISRYVRLNASQHPWTRYSLRQLILQLTADARTSEYYRSEISSAAHAGRPVDVAWVYIYRSESDRALGAFIARAIWINSDSPLEFRPMGFDGETDSTGITIDWNENFQDLVKLVDERRASKAEFIEYASTVLAAAQPFVTKYHYQVPIEGSNLDCPQFLSEFSNISTYWRDEPLPPHECERLGDRLNELGALLDNAKIYADRLTSEETTQSLAQFQKYINGAFSKVRDAEYEFGLVT